MEPVSFAVGVLGLTTAFSTCLECFDYIQLGRNFGRDLEKCILQLDVVKLRLARWGASLGLNSTSKPPPLAASPDDLRLAHCMLEQIAESFEEMEKFAARYRRSATSRAAQADLAVSDPDADLTPGYQTLHTSMRRLAVERQGATSLLRKTKWALFDKRRFDTLIDEVTGFVNDLVELFPAAKGQQRALCEEEVKTIAGKGELQLVDEIAEGRDEVLRLAVRDEAAARGHNVTHWKAGGSSRVRIGDVNGFGVPSRGVTANNFAVFDSATIWIGNQNHGEQGL